jgi:hypothetical protein
MELTFRLLQGHTSLPDYTSFGHFPKSPLKLLFSAASGEALDLLGKFLIYDPRKRISAYDVSPVISQGFTVLTVPL